MASGSTMCEGIDAGYKKDSFLDHFCAMMRAGDEVVLHTAVYYRQIALPAPSVAVVVSGHRLMCGSAPEVETAVPPPPLPSFIPQLVELNFP